MREIRTDTNFWQQYKAIAAGKNKMQRAILTIHIISICR